MIQQQAIPLRPTPPTSQGIFGCTHNRFGQSYPFLYPSHPSAQHRLHGGNINRQRWSLTALLLLLMVVGGRVCHGQDNPLNPNYCEIQPFGTMDGWITKGGNEAYGQIIQPVGDVNGDGVADWLVVHNRVDTSFAPRTAKEVLLYYGVRGGLPSPKSGKRIGPEELGSATAFLSVGRFDSDPYPDLVVAEEVFGDTADGNTIERPNYVVVYWGNRDRAYINSDTSHLLNPYRLWFGIYDAGVVHRSGGQSDMLLLRGGGTILQGVRRKTPNVHVFELPINRRWGYDGESRLPSWQFWNPPFAEKMVISDHDGDGSDDIVLIHQDLVDSVKLYTRVVQK